MKIAKEIPVEVRNEWQKASLSLIFTYGQLYYGYELFFKEFDLTTQQYNVLRILRDNYPDAISTSVLRAHMLDKMSDTSRLVSRLQVKALVDVKTNSNDKRLVNILITEKGQNLLAHIDPQLVNLDALLNGMTEDDVIQLNSLLEKVRESIKTADKRKSTF
jgi:DNA-binding MarR family transcriptional regulator